MATANDAASVSTNSTKPDNREGTAILNQHRVAALNDVDNAAFSFFHVKVVIVAGIGFFTDAYDLFAINLASIMLGYVYGTVPDRNCRPMLSRNENLGLKIATPIGTLFGQLFFGWLADIYGRKAMYGVELIVMICATFGQATAGGGNAIKILNMLTLWRLIVGFGLGGDYPLSATIASEFAATRIRGRMITTVFSMQGFGTLAASIVALVVTSAYKTQIDRDFPYVSTSIGYTSPNCNCSFATSLTAALDHTSSTVCPGVNAVNHVDFLWRLLIGIGAIPAVLALYFRLTVPETTRFTLDVERNVLRAQTEITAALNGQEPTDQTVQQRAVAPEATREDFFRYFGRRENLKMLCGAAISWFCIDVAFYTLQFNSSAILEGIGYTDTEDVYQTLRQLCIGSIILAAGGLIPGFIFCFLLIDKIGRKPIQWLSFGVLTVLFIIMGTSFNKLIPFNQDARARGHTPRADFFFFLFCLSNIFQNFGANTTSFIIPGEIFPTRYRSTAHGICAATGKLGAIVAQIMFFYTVDPINDPEKFMGHSFEILAAFMAVGGVATIFVPETKGKSLEELSGESQTTFVHAPEENVFELRYGVLLPVDGPPRL
ncbi:major facilitator superfamily domain-containing protein [Roridomyces roridus]|uniref:Major facilitator superfamily domain-containing protein n=1 Tax=Roridomyces roridus TaxID=1738132 RepID=A0AAD7FBZ8_9AGAR|nr:major facilitator superfamily domain-containing protein [Roridomyces roridus]